MTPKYGVAILGAVLGLTINIAHSDSIAPTECHLFEGQWAGKWNGGRATAITVKNIKKEGDGCIADVKYAWGELGESTLVREAGSLDVKGSVEGSVLYVPLAKYNASASFNPDGDSVLNGVWKKKGYGDPLSGTFTKQ